MNKKAIGSIFTVIALVLALLKSTVWVMVGLLVAAVVFSLEEKHIKRISQCLMLLLSVLVVSQVISLVFGGFTSGSSIFGSTSDYDNFYSEMTKWIGILLNFYLIVFVVLGAVAYRSDKEMPLYGALVDKLYGTVVKTAGGSGASAGGTSSGTASGTEQNSGIRNP